MNSAEFSQALEAMDATELALGAGLMGVVATLMLVGGLVWFFVSAIGYYKMFKKAGARGWMAFIPLLRDYVRYKISWNVKAFVLYLAALVLFQLLSESGMLLVSLIGVAAGIFLLVLEFKADLRIAKSFGKTTAWGVLLFFFPFVITLILGFGKAEYIGNTTAPAEPVAAAESTAQE